MRKVLLLMVLSALGVMLFASAATATSGGCDTSSPTCNGPGTGNGPDTSATASATSSASVSTSASAAGVAQYQYASDLPDTGGVVSPATLLAIIPAILLVGGGLLSARLIRRS